MSTSKGGKFDFFPPIKPTGEVALGARNAATSSQARVARQSGGKATTVPLRDAVAKNPKRQLNPTYKGRMHQQQKAADNAGRLLSQSALVTNVEDEDLQGGIISLIERGLVPPSFDPTAIINGPGNTVGPISVAPASLHKHVDQFKRTEILTRDVDLGALLNVKLDIDSIERTVNPEPVRAQPAMPQPVLPPSVTPPKGPTPDVVAPDVEELNKRRDDSRTYAELLDVYSLHEFIVRKGQTLRNTPEFTSFQRSYGPQWGAINEVISHLEALLKSYGVPLAYVDGKKVALLASVDMGIPSKDELLHCLANRAEVEPLTVSTAQQYAQAQHGHDVAASKIQSVFRMRTQRKRYQHLRAATLAARLIQRQWAVHRGHTKTRKTLQIQREALIARWRHSMQTFASDWGRIKQSRRVIVHVPSLSYSAVQCANMPFYQQMQRAQLPRLTDLSDDNVEIILVSPLKFEHEALQYYYSMLKASGVRSPETRVVVLVPENVERLPKHVSLTKAALCSQRLMKVLASVIRGKTAFLVPGVVGPDEQMFAARLNLPMLAPEPRTAQVLATKSGAKTVFESADTMIPVGAHNIRSEAELYGALARLVAEYPEYPRWLVKLDAEHSSRGHAYLDVRRLRALEDASETDTPQIIAERVHTELTESAGKRFKLINTLAYPEWAAYAQMVQTMSCCIEAVPAEVASAVMANVMIEPDGTAKLLSVQQQICSPQYVCIGALHPQTTAPFEAIRDSAMSIATAAFRKRIVGYVTIDFIVFRKAGNLLRLWAVDLDIRLTNSAAMHGLAMLTTGATYDHTTGTCVVRLRNEAGVATNNVAPLHYAYSGVMYHPYISALRHTVFFQMCRQRGLSYDTQTRAGAVFHLLDTLLCNCLGVLTVGTSTAHCAALLLDCVDFLVQQLNAANATTDESLSNIQHVAVAARNVSQRAAGDKRRRAAAAASSTSLHSM